MFVKVICFGLYREKKEKWPGLQKTQKAIILSREDVKLWSLSLEKNIPLNQSMSKALEHPFKSLWI